MKRGGKLRVAAIHYFIKSVGGINSECQNFKAAAQAVGDTFDIFHTLHQKSKHAQLYPEPKFVQGGDTFIQVDGHISYHEERFAETKRFLEKNYDVLFFIHPCPHPNTDWTNKHGDAPLWDCMYREIDLPKITRFLDGYYDTYRWIDPVLPLCTKVLVNQPAYAVPLQKAGWKPVWLPKPFRPHKIQTTKTEAPYLVWPNQWKPIKGIQKFFKVLPELARIPKIEIRLFSNGIEYYKMRITEDWCQKVGFDYFFDELGTKAPLMSKYETNFGKEPGKIGELQGPKNVRYVGWVPIEQIWEEYGKAWAMVDLQGISSARSRFPHYAGSFNNTELEALWYGCQPIVHSSMLRSPIPKEFLIGVDSELELPRAVASIKPWRNVVGIWAQAREWITENHGSDKLYALLRKFYGV